MSEEGSLELSQLAGALGVWLLRWCALIPGLLPILALTAVFALPLIVLGLIPVLLLGMPYVAWRAGRAAITALRRANLLSGQERPRGPRPLSPSLGPTPVN